jgi:hypothetical protein
MRFDFEEIVSAGRFAFLTSTIVLGPLLWSRPFLGAPGA